MSQGRKLQIQILAGVLAAITGIAVPAGAQTQTAAENGMVAAANPLAVDAGVAALAAGGSAADALIAVQTVLNLVEPQSSGIGGGAFLLYFDAETGDTIAYDGRETAPAAADGTLFLKPDGERMGFFDAVVGGRSVGVPGTVRLLETIHTAQGRLPWADGFQSAISLANDGFVVSPRLAGLLQNENLSKRLQTYAAARAMYYPNGTALAAGETLENPGFAATLQAIAEGGADAFYVGDIAQDIVDTVASATDNPGLLTLDDLAGYRVIERAPVCMDYRGYNVCGMGPPSSGALTVGQILGVLSHFDLPSMGPDSVDAWHLFAEASKLAYADRGQYMADSDFVSVPSAGLLDPSYLTTRAQLVSRNTAMETPVAAGNPPWRETQLYAPDETNGRPGTSHITVVDGDGDIASMTTTIEGAFGSQLMTAGGFMLNNELTDFSFRPDVDGRPVANRVEAGKRPRSSMAPTIVFNGDGTPRLAIGSPGGSRIIEYVAQTLVAVLDWEMDVQQAIDLGHVTNRNGGTDLEEGTAATALADALVARGHEVNIRGLNSGLHGIEISADTLVGGADPRREGVARGP